jgi:hypothetical protein
MLKDCDVIFADESTASLNNNKLNILNHLKSLNQQELCFMQVMGIIMFFISFN